ncbi:unnamed protein product [Lactuca virosa]|uniref:Uncharacterized protein n=1 Tax=Lactuca virosa TaxID=75947 RepID=A0AAU9PWK2_9ASTR|nr:unnamed protein product [Lactuca virosa]
MPIPSRQGDFSFQMLKHPNPRSSRLCDSIFQESRLHRNPNISFRLSDSDIVKILIARPKSLRKSLKNSIEPTFNLLRDLLQSNEKTLLAIRRCAWVLDLDSQANVIPNMQLLRDVGVPGSKMLYVLTYHPRDISGTKEQFKKVVEEVVEMGVDPLKTNFMSAVHALRSISKSTWEKKMENFLLPVDDR